MNILSVAYKLLTSRSNYLSTTSIQYRPDIDGLRGIAVLSVIIFHYFPEIMIGGFIGVDIFFVISGFLISSLILKDLEANTFSFVRFYGSRIRRIFPVLIIILISTSIYGFLFLLPNDYRILSRYTVGGSFYIINFILSRGTNYFDPTNNLNPLLHLWSLSIEEQFYIIIPLLLFYVKKYHFNYRVFFITLFLVSFIINIFYSEINTIRNFYFPHTRFWELLAGCLIYKFRLNIKTKFSNIISLLSLSIIFICFFTFSPTIFPGTKGIIPILCVAVIISIGFSSETNRILLSNKFLVSIGLISYPMYLFHWPIYSCWIIINKGSINYLNKLCMILLTIVISSLCFNFIEKPIRFSKKYRTYKTILLVIIILLIGITGRFIYLERGFPERDKFIHIQSQYDDYNSINNSKPCTIINNTLYNYYQDLLICKESQSESRETIVIFGDSHASSAYPGISQLNSERRVDTLLFSSIGACNPYIALKKYNIFKDKNRCDLVMNLYYNKIINDSRISKVFIITRGVVYVDGKDLDGDFNQYLSDIPNDVFQNAIQETVDLFYKSGKKIYLVTENPVLPLSIKYLILDHRVPLTTFLSKEAVIKHQKNYIGIINRIKRATIINSTDFFCQTDKCIITDQDGHPLYVDDDHLSYYGSIFQAKNLLPYLND